MNHSSKLRQLFGENRAEWSSQHFKDLFVRPAYQDKLESVRPCFLVGGRGTGKTTSLQSLKYDATFERLKSEGMQFEDQEYLGILVRINKNRVMAFQGAGRSVDDWKRAFAHYFNLLVCLEMVGLAEWLEVKSGLEFSSDKVRRVSVDLGFSNVDTLMELKNAIRDGISELQIYVNNYQSKNEIVFSIAEAPVRSFATALFDSRLLGERVIFCCIDEYENLLDEQQAVINTYIKHAEPPLSYKVGVRKNGLRTRHTLDGQDLLNTPDDYADIEICEEGFEFFARAVSEARLRFARGLGIPVPDNIDGFLEELSFQKEAVLLGCEKISEQVIRQLKIEDSVAFSFFSNKPAHEVYFLKYWQEGGEQSLSELARDWMENAEVWETRIGNHGYSSLFWLSKGRKGARINKYYCGSRAFLLMSAGNIRFFLELIDAAIGHELDEDQKINPTELFVISAKAQTLAVKEVGRRRLDQLEGLADNGVQLKRLVLAIGKIFFEFARSPIGKSPEVTSFVLSGNPEDVRKVSVLLREGVGHLAFEASPRTKPTTNLELRDDEYRLHRIFSGFFEISYRKKRRSTFDAGYLLGVLDNRPSAAISSLLGGVEQSREEDLPEQLAFFSAFYENK